MYKKKAEASRERIDAIGTRDPGGVEEILDSETGDVSASMGGLLKRNRGLEE